jgi:hypothetical protein
MKTYQELRNAYLSHGNVAREAYFMWENAGKPEGKSDEYWFAAVEKLEMAAEMDMDHLDRFSDMGRQIIADGTA